MKKTNTCTLYVSGMHCGACEVLLDKKIAKINGVKNVKASLSDSKVEISYQKGHPPNVQMLNEQFSDLGYSFTDKPIGHAKIGQLEIVRALVVGIVLTVSYVIIDDTKIFARFSLSGESSLPAFVVIGVIASLSTCAALVGGVILSMSKQWNQLYGGKDENKRILPFVLFNLGRLVSFTVLGGLLGVIGSVFQVSLQLTSVLIIGVSVIMVILGLQMLGVSWAKKIKFGFPKILSRYASNEQNFKGKYMPFTIGAMTFFLPCGFTLMAQTVALATGNFFLSALMMLSFALGTLPVLGLLSFSSVKFQKNPVLSGTFNLIVGVSILMFGAFNVNAQLNVLGVSNISDISRNNVASESDVQRAGVEIIGEGANQYQSVYIDAKGFEYFPKNITLKAGILTKLTVNNENVFGCAQSMWLGGLSDKVLVLTGPKSKTEFIPERGRYKISCTMGMVDPIIVTVE